MWHRATEEMSRGWLWAIRSVAPCLQISLGLLTGPKIHITGLADLDLNQLREADHKSLATSLAASLAHAIGTPLNVVAGHAQLIGSGALSADEIRSSAAAIAEHAARIDRLMMGLMELAQPQPLELERVDVGELVDQALAMVGAPAAGVEVSIELDPGERFTLDRRRALQALTSLVREALGGQGVVSIRAGAVDVEQPPERRARPGRYLRVAIGGPGIPDAPSGAELFKPFFSGAPPVRGGLGLQVAHGVMREHRGWMALESGASEGARITVYFPSGADHET